MKTPQLPTLDLRPPLPDAAAKRANALRQARRRASDTKREQVRAAVAAMAATSERISFAAVARRAKVSTWLVYAPGVREHIEAAMKRQHSDTAARPEPAPVSAASLRTDLELARQEIRQLRSERDQLRQQLRGSLDHQLNELSTAPLVARIAALSAELTREQETSRELTTHAANLEDDLDAARRALRDMIKDTAAAPTGQP